MGQQATNGSKVLKSRDSAFPSADAQSERGGEEKEEERGQEEDGEAEKEVKDETGSGANSPHCGNACFLVNLCWFLIIKITILQVFLLSL